MYRATVTSPLGYRYDRSGDTREDAVWRAERLMEQFGWSGRIEVRVLRPSLLAPGETVWFNDFPWPHFDGKAAASELRGAA